MNVFELFTEGGLFGYLNYLLKVVYLAWPC